MKSKKRQPSSSEESEESEGSIKSSSESDSDNSSFLGQRQHRKKRKHADSSDSESDSNDHRRVKKRKHKKKKKKHGKKRRRSDSGEDSESDENESSVSEGEISPKRKRKHKHKQKHTKRDRSSSVSVREEDHADRRLHSVVKGRQVSSDIETHSRTYYQKEYARSTSRDYDREREVQRFYRGSSKEARYQDNYRHERDHRADNRYSHYHQQENYNKTDKDYSQFHNFHYSKRYARYEEYNKSAENDYSRPRENAYFGREEPKGRYNQYEDRAPKKRDYEAEKDYSGRERRIPPENERFQERDYPVKRDRYREERYSPDRSREQHKERGSRPDRPDRFERVERSDRPDRPDRRDRPDRIGPQHRVQPSGERFTERNRRVEQIEERPDRFRDNKGEGRDGRSDGRGDGRNGRGNEQRDDRSGDRRGTRPEPKPRERKSRFTDADDKKEYTWGKETVKKEAGKPDGEKEKPNFGLSGKLTADVNTVNGVVIKYTEPEDAKQPKRRWRFYPFKGDKALPILYIHRLSAFLIGRDKKVADIPLEHPSVSKQHAALQYRATPFTRADGTQGRRVRPYIIDLDSANGTFVNNRRIEARRYVELLERDVVKFGFSAREYVLLHENSKDDALDDDQPAADSPAPAVTTTDKIKQEKRAKQEIVEDGE